MQIPTHQLEERLRQIVEGMLYVATQLDEPRMHRISKIFYFSDKLHLQRYGRPVFSDSYIAMKYGPVPSYAYDVFKLARGDGGLMAQITAEGAFEVQGESVVPIREAQLVFFSESDLECINDTIKTYGSETFARLTTESHDSAWCEADANGEISLRSIIESLPNGIEILEFEEAQSV